MHDLGAVVPHGEDDALQIGQLLGTGVDQGDQPNGPRGLASGQRFASFLGYQALVVHCGVLGEVHYSIGQANDGGNGEQGEEGSEDGHPPKDFSIALAGLQLFQHLTQLSHVDLSVLILVDGA